MLRCPPQYYNQAFPTVKEQKAFEKSLFNKTHKNAGDVILLDNWTIVYRNNVDLLLYVMGSTHENEVGTPQSRGVISRRCLVDAKHGADLPIRIVEHGST